VIDENAFGVLIAYHDVENDEYALSREEFVARFSKFRDSARALLREHRLGEDVRAVDVGHALYVEVAEGDHAENPLAWGKRARATLSDAGFATVVVVTHGGRWVDENDSSFTSTEHVGDVGLVTISNPSEPLRRALIADVASRSDDDDGSGWGPGIYLDTEAAEALAMTPKNAPTVLRASGASFYRAGR
jgi:hypothetical protein